MCVCVCVHENVFQLMANTAVHWALPASSLSDIASFHILTVVLPPFRFTFRMPLWQEVSLWAHVQTWKSPSMLLWPLEALPGSSLCLDTSSLVYV